MTATIIATLLTQLFGAPTLSGLATHYGGPGDHPQTEFRNGEPFAIDARVCAVDDSWWPDLAGATVIVLSDSGQYDRLANSQDV